MTQKMAQETSQKTYLYGLVNSNHNFTQEKSFGKNIFTNAFPVALAVYMYERLSLDPNYLTACVSPQGEPAVSHSTQPLEQLLKMDPAKAFWSFEDSFSGYDAFATGSANRSDLVVKNAETNEEVSAFEVKLVAAPTSGTANKPREQQSCEIVVRPPTIEQMCFSIASSYGADRRHDIGDMIADTLVSPMDYRWNDEAFMLEKLPLVIDAADNIICNGLAVQTPFVLNALWRTIGKSTMFDDECFDVFFWSDLAFLQLFTRAAKRAVVSGAKEIGRPARSVVWLIKSLFDYAAQGTVTFGTTHSLITYGGQTDKAGAFSGNSVMDLMQCEQFVHPRVRKDEYQNIITDEGIDLLSPERRLDGFIKNDRDFRMQFEYATIHLAKGSDPHSS